MMVLARTTVTWSEQCSARCNVPAYAKIDMLIRVYTVVSEARNYRSESEPTRASKKKIQTIVTTQSRARGLKRML